MQQTEEVECVLRAATGLFELDPPYGKFSDNHQRKQIGNTGGGCNLPHAAGRCTWNWLWKHCLFTIVPRCNERLKYTLPFQAIWLLQAVLRLSRQDWASPGNTAEL